MKSSKHALVCAPQVPQYDCESGSRRIYHIIELLVEIGWQVTFAAQYGNGAQYKRYFRTLRQKGVITFAEIDSTVEELIVSRQYEIAIFAFWYLAEQYIPAMRRISPRTRIIVDSIDLHLLREARQQFLVPKPTLTKGRNGLQRTLHATATITADPNPVPGGFRYGKTKITWDTGNGEFAQVFVAINDEPEAIFAEGASGSQDVDWISGGVTYEFRMYAGTSRETLLATAPVTMGHNGGGLQSDYAFRMIREINAYALADAVLTVSSKEANFINDFTADPTLAHSVPDFDELQPSGVPMRDRKGILFIGNFKHAPNIDAVEYLCGQIVPKLSPSLLSDHPVYIVGNALDGKVRSFGESLPYVRMVGWVPSVVPYLERARVSVIPLLYGAGTKRKLLHSLMVGSPTVSTTVGIEGLALANDEHLLVADTADSFASSIMRLLEDETLSKHLAQRGQVFAERLHGREAALAGLQQVIETVLAKPAKQGPMTSKPATMALHLGQQKYQKLTQAVRDVACQTLPDDATVLVVSKGDDELLDLGGRRAWHFLQTADHKYAGHHPADSKEAILQIELLRKKGADFLLFPSTALWWLDHFVDFQQHIEKNYSVIFYQEDVCRIYSLKEQSDPQRLEPKFSCNGCVPGGTGELLSSSTLARMIALYLPQFYPTPENNAWWGPGFTEWTNVTKARPLFDGHYQPHLPADLGFYDLRLAEVREAQANLARSHGLEGFCYWHYWFHGKRVLDRPFDEVLTSGKPDFPFCLAWANETWSRRWHGSGGTNEVLLEQRYSAEDDVAHARWLLNAFADPRYIRVHGRPLFLIYRGTDLPEPQRTIETIREVSVRSGLPQPYIVGSNSHQDLDYRSLGFDATLEFEPQLGLLAGYSGPGLKVYDYRSARELMASRRRTFPTHPCIFVRWDNTSRRGENGIVFIDSDPQHFEAGLSQMVQSVLKQPQDERLVFINAWNEWAEGNHLEPDQRFGDGYLQAVRNVNCRAVNGHRVPR